MGFAYANDRAALSAAPPVPDRGHGRATAYQRAAGRMTPDAELGGILFGMRRAIGCSDVELAYRLRSDPGTIRMLEAGDFDAIGAPGEVARLVRGLAVLVQADPQPILHRLDARYTVPVLVDQGNPVRAPGGQAPAPAITDGSEPKPHRPRKWIGHGRRLGVRFGIPLTVIAMALALALTKPYPIVQAGVTINATVVKPVLAGMGMIGGASVSRRDGLVWIDSDDPRRRKADKLAVRGK